VYEIKRKGVFEFEKGRAGSWTPFFHVERATFLIVRDVGGRKERGWKGSHEMFITRHVWTVE
jgi:hypothetical protein